MEYRSGDVFIISIRAILAGLHSLLLREEMRFKGRVFSSLSVILSWLYLVEEQKVSRILASYLVFSYLCSEFGKQKKLDEYG